MKKFFVLMVFLLLAYAPYTIYATEATEIENEQEEENKKRSEFLNKMKDGGMEDTAEKNLENLSKEDSWIKERDESIRYFLQYLFLPGYHMENVDKYTNVTDGIDKSAVHKIGGHNSLCYHEDEPQNLLNHNCNVPAFGTELAQNVTEPFAKTGLHGQETTSAYIGGIGLGMPAYIPENKVPLDEKDRSVKYSALEVFGYQLPLTSYYGEYDTIVVSSSARLLANVGFWGKVKLGANALLNGIGSVVNDFIAGWTWNPLKWSRKFGKFADGVVATVIDTSDYNVVGTGAWKRPAFNNTLYNAYYMSDKQVIEKANVDFLSYVMANIIDELKKNKETKDVLKLLPPGLAKHGGGEEFPVFVFDPEKYTKESQDAHDTWVACENAPTQDDEETGEVISEDCGTEPELIVMSEEDQFKEWKEEDYQVEYNKLAKSHDIDCMDNAKLYSDMVNCWNEPFKKYAFPTLAHDNWIVQTALSKIEKEYFKDNPKSDVNKGISHYICADEEGRPIGTSVADWKYIYSAENTRKKEFLTKGCLPVRPSIKGAKYGNGENDTSDDTRYLHYLKTKDSPRTINDDGGIPKALSTFFTKVTNSIITVTFTNPVKTLELDKILVSTIETIRDSMYFYLLSFMLAFYGLYLLFSFVRLGTGSLKELGVTFGVVFLSIALFYSAPIVVSMIEDIPNEIERMLTEVIFDDNNVAPYCTVDGDHKTVRQLQCMIWDVGVFKPYLAGQWGTDYESLNASEMKNTNTDLVGSPSVNLGGGNIQENWALWQLSKMKSGTITTNDVTRPTGYPSKALYKLVDLQAGPNNGEKSDGRFLNTWSGLDGNRSGNYVPTSLMTFMLMLVIGGMGIMKLAIVLEMILRVFFLPIILVLGILPKGRTKLFEYLMDIVNVLLKRIFLFIIMTITLNMVSISSNGANYTKTTLSMFFLLIAVQYGWKKILDMIVKVQGDVLSYAKENGFVPRTIERKLLMGEEVTKQMVYGAIGGGLGGIAGEKVLNENGLSTTGSAFVDGMIKGAGAEFSRTKRMIFNRERRRGFGVLDTIAQGFEIGSVPIEDTLKNPGTKLRSDVDTTKSVLMGEQASITNKLNTLKQEKLETEKELKKETSKSSKYSTLKTKSDNLTNEISSLEDKRVKIGNALQTLNSVTGNSPNSKSWYKAETDSLTKAVLDINLNRFNSEVSMDETEFNTAKPMDTVKSAMAFVDKVDRIRHSKEYKDEVALKMTKETAKEASKELVRDTFVKPLGKVKESVKDKKEEIRRLIESEDDKDFREIEKNVFIKTHTSSDDIKTNLSDENIDNFVDSLDDGSNEAELLKESGAMDILKQSYKQSIKDIRVKREAIVKDLLEESTVQTDKEIKKLHYEDFLEDDSLEDNENENKDYKKYQTEYNFTEHFSQKDDNNFPKDDGKMREAQAQSHFSSKKTSPQTKQATDNRVNKTKEMKVDNNIGQQVSRQSVQKPSTSKSSKQSVSQKATHIKREILKDVNIDEISLDEYITNKRKQTTKGTNNNSWDFIDDLLEDENDSEKK